MADVNQLPPEVIKMLLETGELDPEHEALMKQMETADVLRGRATAPNTSKDIFGVMAQGLSGYGSGKAQKEFADKLKPFNQRKMQSRGALFNAMFPSASKPTIGAGSGGAQDATNLGMYPDMADPMAP